MKLITLNCPKCGSRLDVNEDLKSFTCNYCGTTTLIDDEIKRFKYENMEQSGYEFELGRIKAQENQKNKSKKK